MWRLLRRKAEHLVLAGPFGRQIAEAGHSHATRESSFDRRLDEVRREEGERDRHVDISNAAPLSHRYTFNVQLGSAISSSSHRRPQRSTRPRSRGSPTLSDERVAAGSPLAEAVLRFGHKAAIMAPV
jgi:hypothetical protein